MRDRKSWMSSHSISLRGSYYRLFQSPINNFIMGRGGKRVSPISKSRNFPQQQLIDLQGGRGGGGRGKGRGGGGGRDSRDNRVSYDKIEKTNEKFERYYNSIIDLPEEERADFWAALRRELPNSFRFAGSKGYVQPSTCLRLVRTC